MKTGVRGSDLTLTCEAFGNPLPTVQWFFMNESAPGIFINVVEMVSSDNLKRAARLTFNNLSKNNSGIYTCQVRMDSTQTDSADVNLIVVGKSCIKHSPLLGCSMGESVQWVKTN